MEELAEKVNELIRERTSYGVREEVADAPGYVLTWSNGSARWYGGRYDRKSKGERLVLDANEVFVSGVRSKDLVTLIESDMLDPLPLFGGSLERRMAGTPDYRGVELPPAIKAIKKVGYPVEREVYEAIRVAEIDEKLR